MALTWPAEIELLQELVATPSISGNEEAVGRLVEETARRRGLDVVRDDAGVRVEVAGRAPGRTLALVSHLDVVPPGEGWVRDPFFPSIEEGRLYGRGSGDAKGPVAAMLTAAMDVAEKGGLAAGRLVVILGYGEETRNTTMPAAVERTGGIDAAIVGEPTNLDIAVAQRGLMMVDLVARGDQRHAGYASEDGTFTNAAVSLAADLLLLSTLFPDRPHPVLGAPTVTPTMLEGGVSRNVTPPQARAVLDVRSTPAWPHAEIAERLRETLESDVIVTSDRLVPCETPAGSRLLAVASQVRPQAARFGSPTCSDWVFLRHLDAIKCGPGTSRRSHTPDEYIDLHEVTAARRFYARVAEEYLR
ncbi:MAG TPA: M20/M25/M40 family metallo-hydrolase [Gemmatimonadales bacterium]|nr:M20/M25/M40 family metallo-hydrolase [Gemmatimonadales bacterium]